MDKPITRYRIALTVTAIVLAAALLLFSRFLSGGLEAFVWGVGAGLLFMFVGVVINWMFTETLIAVMIILPAVGAVTRYFFPTSGYLIAGEATGLILMIVMVLVFPLRVPAKTAPQSQKRVVLLEEPSPHTMILPSTREQRTGNHGGTNP